MHSPLISFFTRIRELFFRAKLYVRGIYFYEKPIPSDLVASSSLVWFPFLSDGDRTTVTFTFYREKRESHLLLRKKIRAGDYYNYYVVVKLPSEGYDHYSHLDSTAFYFNGRANGLQKNEQLVYELLRDIILDLFKIYAPIR